MTGFAAVWGVEIGTGVVVVENVGLLPTDEREVAEFAELVGIALDWVDGKPALPSQEEKTNEKASIPARRAPTLVLVDICLPPQYVSTDKNHINVSGLV